MRPARRTFTTRWARSSRSACDVADSPIPVVAARSHTHNSPPSSRLSSSRSRLGSDNNPKTPSASSPSNSAGGNDARTASTRSPSTTRTSHASRRTAATSEGMFICWWIRRDQARPRTQMSASGGDVAAGEHDGRDHGRDDGVDRDRGEGAGGRDVRGAARDERLEQQPGEHLDRGRPRVLYEMLERAGPRDAHGQRDRNGPQEHGDGGAEERVPGDPEHHCAEVGEGGAEGVERSPCAGGDVVARRDGPGGDPGDALRRGERHRGEAERGGELAGEKSDAAWLAQEHGADGASGELDGHRTDEDDEQE